MLWNSSGIQHILLRSVIACSRPSNHLTRPVFSRSSRVQQGGGLQNRPVTSFAPLLSSCREKWSLSSLGWQHRQGAAESARSRSSRTAAFALRGTIATYVVHTPTASYSSVACGALSSTRTLLGGAVLRQPRNDGGASEGGTTGEMQRSDEPPTRPRRGRPPASAGAGTTGRGRAAAKSTRKAPRTAAKNTSAAARNPTTRTGRRGPSGRTTAAGAEAASTASHAAALPSQRHAQEKEPFGRAEKVTSDNEHPDDDDEARDAEIYSGQYELSLDDVCAQTSARLGSPLYAVRFVLAQAKDGATVPFLARYRQGETGRMDETSLRQVLDTAKEVKEVHRRRQFMLRSLESRGLLTPALQAALQSMAHVSQLEDAWEPYKERRTSLASRGRAEGLGKYAFALLHANPDEEECMALLADLRAAVGRVDDGERLLTAIVVEDIQRSDVLRRSLGEYCRRTARLTSTMVSKPRKKVAKDMQEESFEHLKRHFAYYDGKSWSVDRIAAHVVLALQRGEAKGVLQVETTSGPKSHGLFMHTAREAFPALARLLPAPGAAPQHAPRTAIPDAAYCRALLQAGLQGAYEYLVKQLGTAVRRDLKKSAEQEAIIVFAHNLHHMLLQRPLSHSRVLAMDPGHTHGVKCVVLDEHGGVETFFTCTLMDEAKMRQYVTQVVEVRKLNKIVIGNGTASGETSELVASLIKERRWKDVEFAVVSEAGASVYSVSDIAKEEFPTLSVMYRGAVSIGRRVLDPLSELVKVPVRSMGIGMYQHDVNEKDLLRELGYVVESCVAKVGISAMSANRYVMEKVPGIQKKIVDQIVLARHAKKLHSREDLRRVPAMTESVFEQIAGFFRFPNSSEPLDNTNIHPESYPLVRRLVGLYKAGQLSTSTAAAAPPATESEGAVVDAQTRLGVAHALQQLSSAQLAALATQRLSCTVETLEQVMGELLHPGLDPRASLPHAGLLRREVHDVRDLRPGEVLSGVVQSVTMFGAFVDCGLHDSVLVRGDGVDTLQVGAYLDKRIRFDALDHLKRPRMFLLPGPNDRKAGGNGGGEQSRRLRLESEDVLAAEGRGFAKAMPIDDAFSDSADAAAATAAPQSLSATISRERRRRADEELNTTNKSSTGNSNDMDDNGGTARAAGSTARPSTTTATPAPFAAHGTSSSAQETGPMHTRQQSSASANRLSTAQKRPRSASPDAAVTLPHLSVQQQQQQEQLVVVARGGEHVRAAPLMAAPGGNKAPRTTFVIGTPTAAPTTGARDSPVKGRGTATTSSTPARPATERREAVDVDVDAVSVDSWPSSNSSDVVFSF